MHASPDSLLLTAPIVPVQIPSIDSRELLRGQRTIEIKHGGQRYTLRVTRENKLILTK